MNFSLDLLQTHEPESRVKGQINKALHSKSDNMFQQYGQDQVLTDFIAPYYINPFQRTMLSNIIGKKNVSDIEMFNALVYSNVIKTRCGDNEDNYLDPVTGKIQCRRKQKFTEKQTKMWNEFQCPQGNKDDPNYNPFAIEKYMDNFGQMKCRTPVLRGNNTCPPGTTRIPGPPDGSSTDTYATLTDSVGLYNGTGVCVPEYTMNSPGMYPYDIIGLDNHPYLHGQDVYEKVKNYVNMFEGVGLNYGMIKDLNKILKNSKYTADFRDKIIKQPSLIPLQFISQHINTDDDLQIANTALFEVAKRKYPQQTGGKTLDDFLGKKHK